MTHESPKKTEHTKLIKYPLADDEKQILRDKLEEVLNRTHGEQVIILRDEDGLKDYYQNMCVPRLIREITHSAKEYAALTNNILIDDHEPQE